MSQFKSSTTRPVIFRTLLGASAVLALGGCEVDSFLFDQSKTGRFEHTPTTIPVLQRIDVIEESDDHWSRATPVSPDDLVPSELQYYLYPGDVVTVSIYELYEARVWTTSTRRIDAGGNIRVPELGDVRAAGLTQQQLEDRIVQLMQEKIVTRDQIPQVDVVVEEGGGLRYTLSGYVANSGMFGLSNPDLRLLDAIAIAGGAPLTTERVFIIRQVPLTDEVLPETDPRRRQDEQADQPSGTQSTQPEVDVEDLIEQLGTPNAGTGTNPTTQPVSPGMLRQQEGDAPAAPSAPPPPPPAEETPPVDIDDLEPVRVADEPPKVDIDEVRQRPTGQEGDSFIYIEERDEWLRVPPGTVQPPASPAGAGGATGQGLPEMIVERVIEVDYQALIHGDSSQNVVIRPNDIIWVDGPRQGFVYIGGEVNRPGVYALPSAGSLTLSRLVTSAGEMTQIGVPERVDLVRKLGPDREAVVRLDLAAIRQRTEPDVVLKPDDHILIGTNFWATPMAIIRNGFRATYGFGFILDRNFGNDVFGAPPEDNNF